MGLYDKFARLANDREQFQTSGLNPFGTCIDEVYSATQGRIGDQKIVLAGTNNYLGLTFDAQAIAAGQAALAALGTGTTGSRMANGSYGSHLTLERELAEFFDRPSAIVFSTGYTANLGVISTLAGPGAVVLIDADSHASIYDACALGGAEIIRFRHNDAADLERRMVRLGERAREAIIIVEGIYSMLGDVAPLVEIVDIKRRLGGYLLVDEAHSFGVMGERGRGLAEALGVEQDVDIILGTFSKSLASIGGFAVGGKGWMCCATAAGRISLPLRRRRPASLRCARRCKKSPAIPSCGKNCGAMRTACTTASPSWAIPWGRASARWCR